MGIRSDECFSDSQECCNNTKHARNTTGTKDKKPFCLDPACFALWQKLSQAPAPSSILHLTNALCV